MLNCTSLVGPIYILKYQLTNNVFTFTTRYEKKNKKLTNSSIDLVKLYSKLLNDSRTEQKPNIPLATQTISIPNTVV